MEEAEKEGFANWANPPSCDMESEEPVEGAPASSAARLGKRDTVVSVELESRRAGWLRCGAYA